MDIKSHPFSLPYIKKEQVAKDTFAFYFDRSKENWEFHPGQYIRMMLPIDNPDDRGTMRYFTISSSPLDTQYLRIITKVIQSSFKMTLFSLKPGEEVSFYGPNGIFYLHEDEADIVLLAGGIGMTPFISMLEYASAKNLQNNISLFVAFSKPDEMIFFDTLTQISNTHQNIKIIYTITKPEQTSWNGENGRISVELIQKYISDSKKPFYYVTGPPPMVEATVKMVEQMGLSEERILQEHFSGY
jgi:ferredoxin-NADP reductase